MNEKNNYDRHNRGRNNKISIWGIVAMVVIIGTLVVWNRDAIFDRNDQQAPPIASVDENLTQDSTTSNETSTYEGENSLPEEKTAPTGQNEQDIISASSKVEIWLPPATGTWSRQYGYQLDPTFDDYRFHSGVDMSLAVGELVFAVADGTVTKAASDNYWGGCIEIEHAGGMKSIYRCITPSGIKEGQSVVAGETIGTVAPSPKAEAMQEPHLHLEISSEDGQQNPLDYIK
ncbi:MAG: peptidoglycan DD-metalloendopeptidase family protein [Bacillota bacterium]